VLTPRDLENPDRESGYRHVGLNGIVGKTAKPYQAYGRRVQGATGAKYVVEFRGRRRATAEEAAQDYCDFVNGNPGASAPAPSLVSAGHKGRRPRLPDDPEVQAALGVIKDARGEQAGNQGYVYCINEEHPGGGMRYVKIGFSTNPQARVAELQTGNPRPLRLHCMKEGTKVDEARIQQKYIDQNVLQEWFRPSKELLLEFDLDANGKRFGS
jgi:hypothetical protein